MRNWPVVGLAMLELLACVPTSQGPEGHAPTVPGTILYAATGPRSMDLWAIPGIGGVGSRVTSTPRAHEFDPEWSPDGTVIAFARWDVPGDSTDIWLMEIASGQLRQLTHDTGYIDRQPTWSPNGKRIAWVRSYPRRGASEIWIMDADGGTKHRLLPGSVSRYDASPDWSPDGSRIVFTSNRSGRFPQLFSVNIDGAKLRRLTRGLAINGNPAWSPDGDSIVFDRSEIGRDGDLWIIDLHSSEQRPLTSDPSSDSQPAWAPDGRHLVFTRHPAGGGPIDLFSIEMDGFMERVLTTAPTSELAANWGPAAPVPKYQGERFDLQPPSPSPSQGSFGLPAKAKSTRITKDISLARYRSRHSNVYALDVDLHGKATVDVALAQDELAGFENTSSMAARHHAIAAVNGDFGSPSGKPMHPFAEDGDLKLSSLVASHNFAVSADQGEAYFGRTVERLSISQAGGATWPFHRWNSGIPSFGEIAAYSAPGGRNDRPPKLACAARLLPVAERRWAANEAGVARDFRVDAVDCSGARLGRQGGIVLAARPTSEGSVLITSLRVGELVTVTWSLGWRGVADSIGGLPMLLRNGDVRVEPCDDVLCGPHPRTGVGVTSDGHLLLLVVDGRQRTSRGMTLVEFARAFRDLGAVDALNLDGGGSSTLVVRGSIVNHPPRGLERPATSALLILPGDDEQEVIESV